MFGYRICFLLCKVLILFIGMQRFIISPIFVAMWAVYKKEFRQFFSSLTGYIAIIVFLLLNGLMLFVFQDSSIFEFGYATLDKFFELSPWILLLLTPAITMRSLAEEFRT